MVLSNLYPQFHSDGRVSICSPHQSFILTLCLENNNLVMLLVLNFIPAHRSSNNCIWGLSHLLLFENHLLHLLAMSSKNGGLSKLEMHTKKGDLVKKMASVRSKNETVVLIMIYIKHIKMFQRLQPPVVELAVL